jgi:hypothetical protein
MSRILNLSGRIQNIAVEKKGIKQINKICFGAPSQE